MGKKLFVPVTGPAGIGKTTLIHGGDMNRGLVNVVDYSFALEKEALDVALNESISSDPNDRSSENHKALVMPLSYSVLEMLAVSVMCGNPLEGVHPTYVEAILNETQGNSMLADFVDAAPNAIKKYLQGMDIPKQADIIFFDAPYSRWMNETDGEILYRRWENMVTPLGGEILHLRAIASEDTNWERMQGRADPRDANKPREQFFEENPALAPASTYPQYVDFDQSPERVETDAIGIIYEKLRN